MSTQSSITINVTPSVDEDALRESLASALERIVADLRAPKQPEPPRYGVIKLGTEWGLTDSEHPDEWAPFGAGDAYWPKRLAEHAADLNDGTTLRDYWAWAPRPKPAPAPEPTPEPESEPEDTLWGYRVGDRVRYTDAGFVPGNERTVTQIVRDEVIEYLVLGDETISSAGAAYRPEEITGVVPPTVGTVLTSIEAVDALPVGTRVKDKDGDIYLREEGGVLRLVRWSGYSSDRTDGGGVAYLGTSGTDRDDYLPATVVA